MKPGISPPSRAANEKMSALIETLHQTGQCLEELTAGEVDTAAEGIETEEPSHLPPSGDEMQVFFVQQTDARRDLRNKIPVPASRKVTNHDEDSDRGRRTHQARRLDRH
jgi:hypothetical protein